MKFDLDSQRKYQFDFQGQVKIGSIPEMLLYDRLRDGRIIGLLIEDLLAHQFKNLTRVCHNGASADLIKMQGNTPKRIQCKSFKENSVSLAPSKMRGMGRKFNEADFLKYFAQIDEWLFVNVATFPQITVYSVDCEWAAKHLTVMRSDVVIDKKSLDCLPLN